MRRLRRVLAALALAPGAGCGVETPAAGPAEAPARRAAAPATSAALGGDWAVAEVNGAPMTREPITVRFEGGLVRAQSGCVSMVWTYALSDGRLRTGPDPLQEPVCDRGRSGFETAFEDTLASSPEAVLAGDGSLRLRGSGGRVTLRRPGAAEPRTEVLAPPVRDCPPSPSGPPPVQLVTAATPAGPVRLLRACSGGQIGMALNGGRLVLRDGCLELDHSPGQPLIWPAGVRLVAIPTTGELRLANEHGEPVRLGAYIGMAGASTEVPAALPPQCAGRGAFQVGAFHPCPDCATPTRPGIMPPAPILPPPPPPPAPPR